MGPNTTDFKELEILIKKDPARANALVFKWQEFAKQNPDTLPTDTETLLGRDIEEVINDMGYQDEDEQMQAHGEVDPSKIPVEFLAQTALALAFRDRPKIIEDDKDYQKLVEQHKKLWLEKNPGKDFTSKEGLDYLYGSLEDEGASTLKKDAEQAFRDNPKFKKRVERYDNEKKKVYKNLDEDPAVINTRYEIDEHTRSRHAYLKTHEDKKTPEETSALIQKRSWERFATENPEKAKVYAKTSTDIKRAHEKQEIKKQLLESIVPTPPRPIAPEYRATTPQAVRRRFMPPGRRVASGIGRLGTRLISRVGTTAGRVAVGALTSNPIGWIVTGIIVAIIIIVFLIILLEGGGGFGGGGTPVIPAIARLYDCATSLNYPTSPANCNSGPPVRCVGPGTGEIVSVDVPDGNTCATNAAVNFSEIEGDTLTAKCVDKCIDNSLTNVCDPDINNTCPDPNPSCGNASGATIKVFCIEYTVIPATPTPAPTAAPTPIPPPTPTPTPSCSIVTIPGPPAPIPAGCLPQGSACSTNGQCCSNDCGPYGCAATPSQTSSFGVNWQYSESGGSSTSCGFNNVRSSVLGSTNIPINHSIIQPWPGHEFCPSSYQRTTNYAVFSFSGFNIPAGSTIKSATLSSPTSGGCEAGYVQGKAGSPTGSFSYSCIPAFTCPADANDPPGQSGDRFGASIFSAPSVCPVACFESGFNVNTGGRCDDFSCGRCSLPIRSCNSSPTSSNGQANVLDIIKSIVSTQDLTSAYFLLGPEYRDSLSCSGDWSALYSSSFTANAGGGASLTIDYCEP